jgi:hypothetical protein
MSKREWSESDQCEPMIKDDDDRKLPARREVPCASPPVDEDADVTKKTPPPCARQTDESLQMRS